MPLQSLPAIIDVEASGFGRGSYPIEIGVALENGTTACFLIHPQPQWTSWDQEAERVHGISRRQLLEHGRPAAEVAAALNHLLHGKTLYTDAWAYDNSWIGKLFDAVDDHPRFRLRSLLDLLDEHQLRFWQQTRNRLSDEQSGQRHRASSDARLIQRTFEISYAEAYGQKAVTLPAP